MAFKKSDTDLSNAIQREPITYEQPEFDVPEKEKDRKWYTQYVRYFSTLYNQHHTHYNTNDIADDATDSYLTPIEKGFRLLLYFFGKQQNIDYNYITTDLSNNTLQSVWVKGKKVRQLINHLIGNLISQLENKEITTNNLSKEVSNQKSRMLEDLFLKHDVQSMRIFEEMEEMGIRFNPAGDRKFESREDIERFINLGWKDNLELISTDTGNYIEEKNDSDNMYIQNFIDYAAADYCAVYNYVENGQVKQKRIPFYNLIWDSINDDPLNKNMKYVGFLERLTPQEIFAKWPELNNTSIYGDAKEQIKLIAKGKSDNAYAFFNHYNTGNIKWWSLDKDDLYVTAVTMFWLNPRDTRYKLTIVNGKVKYEKIKDDDEKGEYNIEDWQKCTLIGNEFPVDWGYANNIVRSKYKNVPDSPIKVMKGNSILGDSLSVIGTIADNQDRMDMLRYKIVEIIGRDTGKNYIIHGDKLGTGITSKELVTDFKSMGLHVANVSGEESDSTDSQRIVETVDMTLDLNIMKYVDLFHEEERIMEEVMNIPKISLGQQQTNIGLGVQRGTIARSTLGLANIYRNFVKFNELNLQYAVNLGKLIYTEPNTEAPMVIGDRGVRFLKWLKEYRYEDILLFIKTKDIINEEGKQRLLGIAQAMAQNQEIDILDYLRIEMSENLTRLYNDLEYSAKKRKKEQMAIQAAMSKREEEAKGRELSSKSEQVATKEIAGSDRVDKEVAGRTFKALVDADAKKEAARQPTTQ